MTFVASGILAFRFVGQQVQQQQQYARAAG